MSAAYDKQFRTVSYVRL